MKEIISLIIWGILIYLIIQKNQKNKNIEIESINSPTAINNISAYYTTKNFIMTKTEQIFYTQLEKKINEKDLKYKIFPQVNLESIVQTKNQNYKYRNKIKSKSIDYTIVSEDTFKIICCIELDDNTHYMQERIQRDKFVNELFDGVQIKLLRVKVSNTYDLESIVNQIKMEIK